MHTTMNCDFVEAEFFYSQPSGQGESQNQSDTLSWLPMPMTTHTLTPDPTPTTSFPISTPTSNLQPTPVPTSDTNQGEPQSPVLDVGLLETVSGTAEPSNSNIQDGELSNTPPSTPFRDPEVNSPDTLFSSDGTDNNKENADEGEHYDVGVDQDTGQYKMLKRSTRGVPPRRYSPDWKGPKTRYSMANLAQGQLTEMARAFEAALYEEEEIPQSFKEAMKYKHWREAMKKEIDVW